MIYLRLFWEFFKVGLFSVGGGLATLPFLYSLGAKTGWFGTADVADMLAVSESTPGPIGVNMATYVGFDCGGVLGGVAATIGLITPSVIIIVLIARHCRRSARTGMWTPRSTRCARPPPDSSPRRGGRWSCWCS